MRGFAMMQGMRGLALCVLIACAVMAGHIFQKGLGIQPDSPRYIASGLNLYQHGVLTGGWAYDPAQAPAPGLPQGGVFTSLELALAAALDDRTRSALECAVRETIHAPCDRGMVSLKAMYSVEIAVFLICLVSVARLLFGDWLRPALALAFALSFKEMRAYSHDVLSEPAFMMMSGLFLLAVLRAVRAGGRALPWLLAGLALGGMALVKPAWSALLAGSLLVLAGMLVLHRDRALVWGQCWGAFALGWVLAMAPLLLRNYLVMDFVGLSDGGYMLAPLSDRLGYNAMGWRELAAGVLFYLPDFGDNAAIALFGQDIAEKLAWGDHSYYIYGRDVLHRMALAKGSVAEAKAFLWSEHFFNTPVKSLLVSVLLAWRGLFVGSLLGLAALLLLVPVLRGLSHPQRTGLLALLLPLGMMVGAQALISVSIPRYNVGLIVPFSLVLAQAVYWLGQRGYRRLGRRG